MQNKPEIKRYKYIDSLRGIAILMVVAVHAGQIVFHPGIYSSIIERGAYGVQLFFIVSALTLFLSYGQRRMVDEKNADKFFFIRRFFRIAPAFYLATCLYTAAFFLKNHIILGHYGSLSWVQVLVFALFSGIFYPPSLYLLPFGGWTVEVEMVFYLIIPFLFKLLSSLKKAILFFILSLTFYIALRYFFCGGSQDICEAYYLVFPGQIPVFAIGIVLFHIISRERIKLTKPYLYYLLLVVYLVAALTLAKLFIFLPEYLLFSLFLGGLVFLMSDYPVGILQNKVTEFFGQVSYSLYLWHFIIILFFWYIYKASSSFWNLQRPLSFFVIYLTTISIGGVISWLSFRYIETPGINAGRKLILNLKKPNNAYEKN